MRVQNSRPRDSLRSAAPARPSREPSRLTPDRARFTFAYLLLVEAIVASTLGDLLEPNRIPLVRDTLFFFVPYKQLLVERLSCGELPLWNPYIYMGTPLLASFVSSALYPLNPLLALWPPPRSFDLFRS